MSICQEFETNRERIRTTSSFDYALGHYNDILNTLHNVAEYIPLPSILNDTEIDPAGSMF
jgi:hypothetical protein